MECERVCMMSVVTSLNVSELKRWQRVSREERGLLPLCVACVFASVSRQRMRYLADLGRLHTWEFGGREFWSGRELELYVRERWVRSGGPLRNGNYVGVRQVVGM